MISREPPPAGVVAEPTNSGFVVVVDGESEDPDTLPRQAAFMVLGRATDVPRSLHVISMAWPDREGVRALHEHAGCPSRAQFPH